MRRKIISIIAMLAAMVSPSFAQGGEGKDYGSTEYATLVLRQYKDGNVFKLGHEAALLDFNNGYTYADINLGGEMSAGSFHRPQQPKSRYDIRFDAEGAQKVGLFYLSGGFAFRQSYQNDIRFSSVFEPMRTMPYIIVDSTGGNWTKQSYDIWTDISLPVYGRLAAGLGLDLSVNRGAKKTDPRPRSNTNRITLKPSLAFDTGRGGIISAAFIFSMFKESSNLILYDSSQPQKLYLLKGLGQYTYEIFSNTERERKYDGNALGFSMSYIYNTEHFSAGLYGRYLNDLESVYDLDYNKPHYRGRLYKDAYDVALQLNFTSEKLRHSVSANFEGTSASGREIVQIFNPSPEINSWVTDSEIPGRYRNDEYTAAASYGLWIGQGSNYLWHIALTGRYCDARQNYAAMASFMKYRNAGAELKLEKLFYLRKGYFKLDLGCCGMKTLNSGYAYTERETEDDTIRTGLMEPDYSILSTDYGSVSAGLGYGCGLKRGRTLWLSIGGNGLWSRNGLSRYGAIFIVGYSF